MSTSACPQCRAKRTRQSATGVWYCPDCGHEFEPFVVDPATSIEPYTGELCPKTDREHRVDAVGRCRDCHGRVA